MIERRTRLQNPRGAHRALLPLLVLIPFAAAAANEPGGGATRSDAQADPPRDDPGAPREPAGIAVAKAGLQGAAEPGPAMARVPTPIERPPAVPGPALGTVTASPWWSAGFQSTYILQRKAGFSAPYTGPNSLTTEAETGYTLTATLFLGVRPWEGAEAFFNPETIQSQSISHLSGLGGLSNGENQKGGGPTPTLYRARAFVRQTIALGGEISNAEAGPNQFGGPAASRRLVMTAGNFSWADVFDGNACSHDPRTQFLNWALMSYGAFDYAADVRGYTWGIALEYYREDWVLRAGRFALPVESNGLALDLHVLSHYGDTVEIEHDHTLLGMPGKLRAAGFRNHARTGSFRDALQHSATSGGVPDVGDVRRDQSKYGVGVSLEQAVLSDVALFARYSRSDGRTETYTYAEIERSLAVGVSVKGRRWRREGDTLGVAFVANGLSDAHRDYLVAGGVGFLIGDGRLEHYRPEQILEAYYSFNAFRGLWVSIDGQRIANPAYNADRGPVNVIGTRFHVEY